MSYFVDKFVILIENSKNMGPLGDKFVIFDQQFQKNGAFGWQNIICRGLWVTDDLKKGALWALHSVPWNMEVPPRDFNVFQKMSF